MKDRCYRKSDKKYKNYGGRGIRICDEWLGKEGFLKFRKWSYENGYDENAPFGQCTIDRIDVNGNYCPENCRWVDMKTQANNRTNNNYIFHNGQTKTLSEWAKFYGVNQDTLWRRIYQRNMSLEKALLFDSKRRDVTKEKCEDLRKKGLTIEQVAKTLNCSIATVERRIYGYSTRRNKTC